jgi:hypothetical protein
MDANVWARGFMRINKNRMGELTHEIMRAWFANALMTGYDYSRGPINGAHAAYLLKQEAGK